MALTGMRTRCWVGMGAVGIALVGCQAKSSVLTSEDAAADATSLDGRGGSGSDTGPMDAPLDDARVPFDDATADARVTVDDAPSDGPLTADDAGPDAPGTSGDATLDASIDSTTDGAGGATDGTVDGSPSGDASTDGAGASDSTVHDAGPLDAGDGSTGPSCPALCGAGEVACDGQCVSATDPNYGCGSLSCQACNGGASSVPGVSYGCSAGACVVASCPASRADCDGLVGNDCEADLDSPATCGTCGHACATGQVCDHGTCASGCTFPETNCSGSCVDLSSDALSCGSCGKICGGVENTGSCVNASCVNTCDPGWSACGGLGTGCPYDIENGSTSPPSPAGSAPARCGSSCVQCPAAPSGEVAQCVSGQCENVPVTSCGVGLSLCPGGTCVDERGDPANCGGCGVTCGAGQTCAEASCVSTASLQIVTGLTSPSDIAVDAHNLYFVDNGANTVWQADKTTFAQTALGTNQASPTSLAVDATNVYWTSNLGGAILVAPIGGGSPPRVLTTANKPTAIAVDDSFVYWSDDGTRSIVKAPKTPDAGAPVTLVSMATAAELKIDATRLYAWNAQLALAGGNNAVGAFSIDKETGVVTSYAAPSRGVLRGIAVNDSYVIYGLNVQNSTQVHYVDVDIKSGPDLAANAIQTTSSTTVWEVAADDCDVYWTTDSTSLWTTPLTGIVPARQLTSAATQSGHIAVDDTYVYWTDQTWIGRVPR